LAAALLALACSIVAVVLAVDARDNSASSGDIASLEEEFATLENAVAAAAMTAPAEGGGGSSTALEQRMTTLESQVNDLAEARDSADSRISVLEDDIENLRSQISDLNGGDGG
jgi:hypothetical protein